jgi:hypothetical protein
MDDLTRFLRFCSDPTERGCIEWTGAIENSGYAAFKMGGKKIGAHRAALLLRGIKIPRGMDVMHSCDNRKCVSLDHLSLGTRSENMADAAYKGRLGNTFTGE